MKFVSTVVDYYESAPKYKKSHSYKIFSPRSNEYNVVIEINSKIKLSKEKVHIEKTRKESNKSTPKSPHPRRAHTRNIAVKDSNNNIIGYRSIQISSSYIHGEAEKPINVKEVE